MLQRVFVFVFLFVIIGDSLHAEKDSKKSLDSLHTNLDPVIVSANKLAEKQSQTGKVVSVISRETIDKHSGLTLGQLLNQELAGVVVNGSQNTLGTNQSIYMQGAGTANTLILIDGQPIFDPSGISFTFDINHIDLEQIDHIEVLKGIQSTLYGADAVGGVINVILRQADTSAKGIQVRTAVQGGTYGTYKGNVSFAGNIKPVSYRIQYDHLQSDGFASAIDTLGNQSFLKDFYYQDNVNAQVKWYINSTLSINAHGHYDKYKTRFPAGAFTDANNILVASNAAAVLGLTKVFKKGRYQANFNYNYIERKDTYNPQTGNDKYSGNSYYVEQYLNYNFLPNLSLLVGTDFRGYSAGSAYYSSYFQDTTIVSPDSLKAYQFSGYANVSYQIWKNLHVDAGVRYTKHSTFGNVVNYSINPSYLFFNRLKVYANIASGFRAPVLTNVIGQYGNPNLKPEYAQEYEGGVQYFSKTLNLSANYFNRTTKNLIIFGNLPNSPYGQYKNANQQQAQGVEFEGVYEPLPFLRVQANYTFTTGKLKDTLSSNSLNKDTTYNNLYRIPKHNFYLSVGYSGVKNLYVNIGLRWLSNRTDLYFDNATFKTTPVTLKSYYNLNLYADYAVLSWLKVFGDFENITNQKYSEVYGYNARRFNFMLGVKTVF